MKELERHAVEVIQVDISQSHRFAIAGVAGVARGSSYPSYDLDVAYSREPENLDRLVAALRELDVTLRGAPP